MILRHCILLAAPGSCSLFLKYDSAAPCGPVIFHKPVKVNAAGYVESMPNGFFNTLFYLLSPDHFSGNIGHQERCCSGLVSKPFKSKLTLSSVELRCFTSRQAGAKAEDRGADFGDSLILWGRLGDPPSSAPRSFSLVQIANQKSLIGVRYSRKGFRLSKKL